MLYLFCASLIESGFGACFPAGAAALSGAQNRAEKATERNMAIGRRYTTGSGLYS